MLLGFIFFITALFYEIHFFTHSLGMISHNGMLHLSHYFIVLDQDWFLFVMCA